MVNMLQFARLMMQRTPDPELDPDLSQEVVERGYLVRPERYLNLPLFLMSCTVDWLRERPDCTSQGCFKLKLKSFSLKVCNHVTNCTIIGVCLYKSILFQSPYLKFSEKLNDQSCVSYTV